MPTPEIYPEYLNPENFLFEWPGRNKFHLVYKRLLKEGNDDHKYLRCLYIQENKCKVLHGNITLDKIDLAFAEKIRAKPTGNDIAFIA